VNRFWVVFFIFWPIVAVVLCAIAPSMNWWFPGATGPTRGEAASPLGQRIDDLFYMILVITSIVFILTQAALGFALWTGATRTKDDSAKSWFSHGSHNLEVMWTIVPAGVLLFIALYQMDVWAEYRIKDNFPQERMEAVLTRLGIDYSDENLHGEPVHRLALAEVTARQFEWRIRYPGFDADGNLLPLMRDPQPTDLYAVNDLHLPVGNPVMIQLRSGDVQHSFFLPELRVKQDAVPGLVIPVWFEANASGEYTLLCAELCGWGHYKMKAQFVAETEDEFLEYLRDLHAEQNDDAFLDHLLRLQADAGEEEGLAFQEFLDQLEADHHLAAFRSYVRDRRAEMTAEEFTTYLSGLDAETAQEEFSEFLIQSSAEATGAGESEAGSTEETSEE
jgi:cytochrome c oxidase subunit 2